jgi:hypothetical protein
MKSYNPLEKRNLAESVVKELLEVPISPLEALSPFEGAGVYVIYYVGDFKAYAPYKNDVEGGVFDKPIYVGKADPEGGRIGGNLDAVPGNKLYGRLRQHLKSIQAATNLDSHDFYFRHLVVDDIWIPLGENLLISIYRPIWNVSITGFGIHKPGSGREKQKRSLWDTVHPGRTLAANLPLALETAEQILVKLSANGADDSSPENGIES